MTNLPALRPDPLNRRIKDWLQPQKFTREVQIEPQAFGQMLDQLFRLCHFPQPHILSDKAADSGTALATKTDYAPGDYYSPSRQDKCDLIVNWRKGAVAGVTEIAWICVESAAQYVSEQDIRDYARGFAITRENEKDTQVRFDSRIKGYLRFPEMYQFAALLGHELLYTARSSAPGRSGYVLGPGELPDTEKIAEAGFVAKDYSSCAQAAELDDLKDGVLPLGQYVFGKSDDALRYGPRLYLGPHDSGALREYDGTLIVAPINRGKTQLLKRWTVAANRAGYSILLVDVKGNLFAQLRDRLKGRILHFTTDPNIRCGDTSTSANASDRMNLLDGLEWRSAEGRKRIDSIVEILLPAAGWRGEGGEAGMRFANRVRYLRALINILLMAHHYSSHSRAPDLGDLYDLANSEARLMRCLRIIAAGEGAAKKNGPVPGVGFAWWANEVAPLISSKLLPQLGQRDPTKAYTDYTFGVLLALRPFARDGIFHSKIASHGPGGKFSLDLLDGREQTTLVLSLRTQDGLESDTLFSIAAKRLEQVLFERFNKDDPRPVLLLMDEAIRLREFDPPAFIAVAREAKAGCVAVYQSLDPIEDSQRRLLLSTVGTQIYLGSLPAGTARTLTDNLPKRKSNVPSIAVTESQQGRTRSISFPGQEVPLVGMAELTQLPAWPYSAFVYIRDHRSGKPFIVDLDERPTRVMRVGKSPAAQFESVEDAIKNIVTEELTKHISAITEESKSPAFWKQLAALMPPRVQIRVESGDYTSEIGVEEWVDVLYKRESAATSRKLSFAVVGNIEIVADDPALPKPRLPGVHCRAGAISLRSVNAKWLSVSSDQRVEAEDCVLESASPYGAASNALLRDCSLVHLDCRVGRIRIEGGDVAGINVEGTAQAVLIGAKLEEWSSNTVAQEAGLILRDCTGRLAFLLGSEESKPIPGPPSLRLRGCDMKGGEGIWAWDGRIEIAESRIRDSDSVRNWGVIDANVRRDHREDHSSPLTVTVSVMASEIDAYRWPLRAGRNVTVTAVDSRLASRNSFPLSLAGARARFQGCELHGGLDMRSPEGSSTFENCELVVDSADHAASWFDSVEQQKSVTHNVTVDLRCVFNHPSPGTIEAIHSSPRSDGYYVVARQSGRRWLVTRERYQTSGAEEQFVRFDELKEGSTLAFSNYGGMVLEMSEGLLRHWHIEGYDPEPREIALPPSCHGSSVAALSGYARIAVAAGSQVYLHADKQWRLIEEARLSDVRMLRFAVDGNTLMIGGTGGLSLYDLAQRRVVRRFKTPAAAVAADMRHSNGAIAILTEDRLVWLVGSSQPVFADLARLARDRLIGKPESPACPLDRMLQPSLTFLEWEKVDEDDPYEDDPSTPILVVCGLPGAAYVLNADTLKSGVAIAGEHTAVGDNANLLVTRGDRILDFCLVENGEFEEH